MGRGTRGRGDVGLGDAGKRGRGDLGTRGRGNAGTRGSDKQIAPDFYAELVKYFFFEGQM